MALGGSRRSARPRAGADRSIVKGETPMVHWKRRMRTASVPLVAVLVLWRDGAERAGRLGRPRSPAPRAGRADPHAADPPREFAGALQSAGYAQPGSAHRRRGQRRHGLRRVQLQLHHGRHAPDRHGDRARGHQRIEDRARSGWPAAVGEPQERPRYLRDRDRPDEWLARGYGEVRPELDRRAPYRSRRGSLSGLPGTRFS